MPDRKDSEEIIPGVSRRDLLAATSGLAALAASGKGWSAAHREGGKRRGKVPQAPFDSLRDYMAMMEANGLVMHIPRIDQDKYHATALFYRMTDMFGKYASPADRVRRDQGQRPVDERSGAGQRAGALVLRIA